MNEIFTVRNKTELNSVMKHFRPESYKSVYEFLRLNPSLLPKHYPAVLIIEENETGKNDLVHYKFHYLYATQIESISNSVKKAIKRNESYRGRKMAGTFQKKPYEDLKRCIVLRGKHETKLTKTTGITFKQ